MDKERIIHVKPYIHLSTYTMETWDYFDNDDFDEAIHEYVHQIRHCSSQSEAIIIRSNALKFIDQWRLQRLDQIDQRIRAAGQSILNAFDQFQSRREYIRCPHRFKKSSDTSHNKSSVVVMSRVPQTRSIGSMSDLSSILTTNKLLDENYSFEKMKQSIQISINKIKSPSLILSPHNNISLNLNDIGRDFTYETLAHLSPSSNDIAMSICENNTFIYCQNKNELVIVSHLNPKFIAIKQLDKNSTIYDICYVDWLSKCLVIADKYICLLDYRTTKYDIIDVDDGYICGAIDNKRCIFYVVKQSTLYKYDKDSLLNHQADQYPIADGYFTRRMTLDNKTNDVLALLVLTNDKKNYILVYSTKSLSDGYLYKIILNDHIEREWICSNGCDGWLVRGTHPGSCFDLNIHGLCSVRTFDSNEICNIIPMKNHQRFIIRTKMEIFVLIKYSSVQSF